MHLLYLFILSGRFVLFGQYQFYRIIAFSRTNMHVNQAGSPPSMPRSVKITLPYLFLRNLLCRPESACHQRKRHQIPFVLCCRQMFHKSSFLLLAFSDDPLSFPDNSHSLHAPVPVRTAIPFQKTLVDHFMIACQSNGQCRILIFFYQIFIPDSDEYSKSFSNIKGYPAFISWPAA